MRAQSATGTRQSAHSDCASNELSRRLRSFATQRRTLHRRLTGSLLTLGCVTFLIGFAFDMLAELGFFGGKENAHYFQ